MDEAQKKIAVYYDGTCTLCSGIVQKLEHSSQNERFESVPIQKTLPSGITREEALRDVHVVDPEGTAHKGADAILYILSQYPRFRWIASVGNLPGIKQVASFAYRIIADNRHQL